MSGKPASPAGKREQRSNDLLRQARLYPLLPTSSGPMSQRELADAVSAYLQRTTGRDVALDRHYISRLERGVRRRPKASYRAGLRAVLGAETDAELGFVRTPGMAPGTRQARWEQVGGGEPGA